MLPSRVALITLAVASVTATGRLWADPDPDLPQPLDLSVAAPLITKSPFTRALNLSEKLQLTGIAFVQGKPVATLMDRETKQNYLVSEEPNSQGWKLAKTNASTALKASSVQLQVGSETVTIHYGDSQLTPTSGSGRAGPSVWPSEQEVMRTDENGKQYVRSSAYLSDADRDRYYRGWSREAHDKYRGIIMDQQEVMLKASPQQRADIAKKVFDQVDAEEKARGGSPRNDSGGSPYRGGPPGSSGGSYSPYRGGPPGGSPGGPSFSGGGRPPG
jgi:hypothetical protein